MKAVQVGGFTARKAADSVAPEAKPVALRHLAERLERAFEPGMPVSFYEAEVALRGDYGRARQALAMLVSSGEFDPVADHLWVRLGAPPNPYLLGARLIFPYAFSHGAALALHARQPLADRQVFIASPERFHSVDYGEVTYRHVKSLPDAAVARVYTDAESRRDDSYFGGAVLPESVIAATPERALADCISRPERAGGLDALIAMASALPELDPFAFARWFRLYDVDALAERALTVLEHSGLAGRQPELRDHAVSHVRPTGAHAGLGKVAAQH